MSCSHGLRSGNATSVTHTSAHVMVEIQHYAFGFKKVNRVSFQTHLPFDTCTLQVVHQTPFNSHQNSWFALDQPGLP
eukprot:5191390-Amphidinium_carterae.1